MWWFIEISINCVVHQSFIGNSELSGDWRLCRCRMIAGYFWIHHIYDNFKGCLMASSYYLNQCWLLTYGVLYYSFTLPDSCDLLPCFQGRPCWTLFYRLPIFTWMIWVNKLVQVMACCLTAPSHYLNQRWLFIKGVLCITLEGPKDPHLRNSRFRRSYVTSLTLQYLWPRPPGVWLGGPGC